MQTITETIHIHTKNEGDVVDITEELNSFCRKSGIKNGIINIFVPGSTGSITTIEFEPGLVKDMKEALQRLFPREILYAHNERWGDGNGHSHIRASFIGPSLTIPVHNSKPCLGTWQQVVFIEMDIRPRNREIIFTIIEDT